MTDVWFYHLERHSIDRVLPGLIEKCLERGWRAVIQTPDDQAMERIDTLLWTFSEESFLAHGTSRDKDAERQPVYVTCLYETPNDAAVRFCVEGADPAPALLAGRALERLIVIFDGREGDAVALARAQWSALKKMGHALTYWQQGESGGWQKKA